MATSVSYAVSIRITNIGQRVGGPRANIGRGLIQNAIRILTCIVHFIIYILSGEFMTNHFLLSYLIHHELWVLYQLFFTSYISNEAASDIDFVFAAHPFITKIFQQTLFSEK